MGSVPYIRDFLFGGSNTAIGWSFEGLGGLVQTENMPLIPLCPGTVVTIMKDRPLQGLLLPS